jgi:hypothetical protein
MSPRPVCERLLAVVVALAAAGTVYPEPAPHARGRSDAHAADPCEHEPPGEAVGRDRLCAPAGSSSGIARGDFNADGFADLAVGAPFDDLSVGGVRLADAGTVTIIYASRSGTGLDTFNLQRWRQGLSTSAGAVAGELEAGDQFGAALAAGDFNNDRYSDLAIGVPGEDGGAGAVNVLYGGPDGLTTVGAELLRQGFAIIDDQPEAGDRFGGSLTWGDFNHDGFGDLVVGVALEDTLNASGATIRDAGAVHVLYGSDFGIVREVPPFGFPVVTGQFIHQDAAGIAEVGEDFDRFGDALTAGDFNADEFFDLAIGVPGEDVNVPNGAPISNAGRVQVIYGSAQLLQPTAGPGQQVWSQNSAGITDTAEAGDLFGGALATGDLDRDGIDDLAVGVSAEDVNGQVDAGGVNVILGSTAGLSTTVKRSVVFLTQDTELAGFFPIEDQAEPGDRFGFALAIGDFDGDGDGDLAVGAPFEDLRDFTLGLCFQDHVNAGAVNVIYGGPSFPVAGGSPPNQFLFQGGSTAIAQPRHQDDDQQFGYSLTAWNFGRGPNVDLAVGVPGDVLLASGDSSWKFTSCGLLPPLPPLAPVPDAGAVEVLYGPLDLRSSANQKFRQGTSFTTRGLSVGGTAEVGDRFGRVLY